MTLLERRRDPNWRLCAGDPSLNIFGQDGDPDTDREQELIRGALRGEGAHRDPNVEVDGMLANRCPRISERSPRPAW